VGLRIVVLCSFFILNIFSDCRGDSFQDAEQTFNSGDFRNAYQLLLPLAKQGQIDARFNLGYLDLEEQIQRD
jgi:hypothetical protein